VYTSSTYQKFGRIKIYFSLKSLMMITNGVELREHNDQVGQTEFRVLEM